MAAIASFSVAHENGQYQYTLKTRKPIYQVSRELWKKMKSEKKIFSHQVAAILIIGVKLKI